MENNNLSKALKDFQKKYPSVTSADLQTFIIAWKEHSNIVKEYLFNTAESSGEKKNIEEWYLKQTVKFINDDEHNSQT